MDVGIVDGRETRSKTKDCAEKSRTIIDIEFVEGVHRSPSEANVGDRVCERYGDIERRTEKTVRYDKISVRRRSTSAASLLAKREP